MPRLSSGSLRSVGRLSFWRLSRWPLIRKALTSSKSTSRPDLHLCQNRRLEIFACLRGAQPDRSRYRAGGERRSEKAGTKFSAPELDSQLLLPTRARAPRSGAFFGPFMLRPCRTGSRGPRGNRWKRVVRIKTSVRLAARGVFALRDKAHHCAADVPTPATGTVIAIVSVRASPSPAAVAPAAAAGRCAQEGERRRHSKGSRKLPKHEGSPSPVRSPIRYLTDGAIGPLGEAPWGCPTGRRAHPLRQVRKVAVETGRFRATHRP